VELLAAGSAIFEYEADGILCHRKCFFLGVALGDDLRQRRNEDREAALRLRFKDDRECPIMGRDLAPWLHIGRVSRSAQFRTTATHDGIGHLPYRVGL
jgi:hypothetical protein